ncbi:ABC transporter substrate-binding protein [Zarconia navalis]|uniref:ABC transporter substrate-binding protein n=1 Tax=Zarconia navalis TaxID=2992134 RepID=UPI0021F9051E|nr:ABC transporter substrate-binding protein [Zarconia navalis]
MSWLCCCLLLVGCSSSPSVPIDGDRIRIGTTAEVKTLDPADAYELSSTIAIYNLGDRLYRYQAGTTQIEPQLATALPQISADGLTYTIPLRQDVTFQDGTPFDAEAMAFSLRRFIENKGRPSFLLSSLVESVAATGQYELTIQLQQPFAPFTALLTFPGLCAVSPQAYKIGEGKFKPKTFVGTGPYQIAEYGTDLIRLQPFDGYWGTPPANSGIDLQRFSSKANLYNAFRTQAVDVAYQSLDTDQIHSLEELASEEGLQVFQTESPVITYLVVNVRQPPLDRLEVRQAIATAIDRQLLDERVFYGEAEPLYSLLPTTFETYKPAFQTRYGDGNSDKAKELLRQAGYSPENPLTVEIWYSSDSASGRLGVTVLKAAIDRDLDGIMTIEPRAVEATTAYGFLDRGVYPMFMLSWYADFFDADNYIKPFIDCEEGTPEAGCTAGESQYHGSFYYNDRANELIEQQRVTRNPQERAEIFAELQDIVAEDVPFIPLWQAKEYAFAQSDISGIELSATQQILPFWPIERK